MTRAMRRRGPLYGKSFPRHEQREAASQAAILTHSDYRFNLIYDGDEFVGLLLCWETDNFIYVEHFCVEPSLRGHGLGTLILAELARQNKTIILEIDPLVDDASVRRKGFYECCGYVANAFAHVHPPYRAGFDGHGHRLVIFF